MASLSEWDRIVRRLRVQPGARLRLKDRDTGWMGTPELKALGKDELKERATRALRENVKELARAQELLWASDTHALLIILQGLDASGKDGTIKHVMSGINPQGCTVHTFKQPSAEDLDHTFLWRHAKAAPERGKIGVFNRSHYEDVVVPRVHPEWLEKAKLPPGKRGKSFWDARYEDINNFERHLVRNGTVILKFFLHISKEEQKQRFLARLEDPAKNWKFNMADLEVRRDWEQYMEAYGAALARTSTAWAPWWVIPADHKFVTRVLVAEVVTNAIASMKLRLPKVTPEQRRQLEEARRQLEAE